MEVREREIPLPSHPSEGTRKVTGAGEAVRDAGNKPHVKSTAQLGHCLLEVTVKPRPLQRRTRMQPGWAHSQAGLRPGHLPASTSQEEALQPTNQDKVLRPIRKGHFLLFSLLAYWTEWEPDGFSLLSPLLQEASLTTFSVLCLPSA